MNDSSGPGWVTPSRLAEPAPLVHRDGDAERRAHRQQEPGGRDDRHDDRAEDEHEDDERQPDDDERGSGGRAAASRSEISMFAIVWPVRPMSVPVWRA